jgi:2-phospho-L-lactate guanylyltransferase
MAEVIIAVRGGPRAKSRCRAALGERGCAALVQAMLDDMLKAVAATPCVDRVYVVTPTKSLADLGRSRGASVISEETPFGLNSALAHAQRQVASENPDATLALLPGDLPWLEPGELRQALDLHDATSVVLVPATADGGTGAIVLRADLPLPLAFGVDSFRRHVAAAFTLGLTPRVLSAPSLGFDIDRPADLEVARASPRGRTGALLRRRDPSAVA